MVCTVLAMMKICGITGLLTTLGLGLMAGCGGNGGGGNESGQAAIEGLDFSGTYLSDGVFCFNLSGVQTASATATGSSETLQINGNNYSTTTNAGTCTTTTTGKIIFRDDDTVTILDGRISVPSGTCTFKLDLYPSPPGSITPQTISSTSTNGEVVSTIPSAYIRTSLGHIGLYSIFTVVGSPSDICFFMYLKQ
jgi:hypothetical protein